MDGPLEYDEQERKFRTAKSAFEDITKDLGEVEKLEKIDFRAQTFKCLSLCSC
jgi:hypothetical protein